MSNLERIDQILAHVRRQQAKGGLTYRKAVDIEFLITSLERIRACIPVKECCTAIPASHETVIDVFIRGL